MCGIAGFQGAFDELLLGRMGQMLAHRGPDDHGTWFDLEHRVGFAHRRLSIIDLSPRGHQPMPSASGRYWLIYNGEVYNYRELRQELRAAGLEFQSDSDSEVILQLMEWGGISALERLEGMFAFAL
jgi:asparagine synthase (glutamine-hydrolysing)